MIYQIFKKEPDDSWFLIEEMEDDLVLADRMLQLRQDGSEYRAEQRNGHNAQILDV